MKIIKQIIIFLSIFCFIIIPITKSNAADLSPEELKQAIDNKTKEYSDIVLKRTQAEQDLKTTEGKSKSLQNELKKSDYTINQLNLSIKSSELNIQKLTLEIEALKFDIGDTESQIDIKKLGIAELLRELQKKDMENVLVILLKNKSIAESIDEAQGIMDINSGLSGEVSSLQVLNGNLSNKLTDSSTKKSKVELENKNLKSRKVILQNEKTDRQNLLVQTKNTEKNYQALIVQLEKDQDALSKEIEETEAKLRASFDPNLLPSKRPGVLSWPIKLKKDGGIAIISQRFGQTSYSARLYKSNFHNGLDFGVPVGTPVFAAEDGIIISADSNDKSSWQKYQYGKHVMIEHQNNLNTLYAHLSVIEVIKGQTIKRGELIGYSGNSGYSTGPHLHLGVYWRPSVLFKTLPPAKGLVPVGVTINPEDYL